MDSITYVSDGTKEAVPSTDLLCDAEDDAFDEDDEEHFDCGMMADGSCQDAGSESCEFDCPFRRRSYSSSISGERL